MVIIVFELYIFLTLTFTYFDESWNVLNPTPYPRKIYFLLNWEQEDFHFWIDGTYILKKNCETDNKLKTKARRYWHEHKAK